MPTYRIREGLPPYGAPSIPFPSDFGRLGREGLVVEFQTDAGAAWTGNFKPGLNGLTQIEDHPDGRRVLVFSGGDLWVIDPSTQEAESVAFAIDARWTFAKDLILSRQGLAFLRFGPSGVVWHTRRLSWDGFDEVRIVDSYLYAVAWSAVEDRWIPCSVDLISGLSQGGSFGEDDRERWERLAASVPG
jgi:hypothetical protein